MKKIKIGRYSFVNITKDDDIDYKKWIDFIESHKDYFIWYEDTEEGKKIRERIDEFSQRVKEGVLYKLNKTNVYCTKKTFQKFLGLYNIIQYRKQYFSSFGEKNH